MNNFYLGCDASKGYSDFVILNESKKIVEKNFQLDDTRSGHQSLIETLTTFVSNNEDAALYAGFESTGGYEANFLNTLKNLSNSLNINVALVNPLGVKLNMEADLTRNKTDEISARGVAEYLIEHSKKVIYNRVDDKVGLRKIWSFINLLIKQRTQWLNQFHGALYKTHPDLLTYCKDGVPAWVLRVVIKYPCALKLSRASWKKVNQIPYVSQERAKELVKNARASIGCDQDEFAQFHVKSLAEQIFNLHRLIEKYKKSMMSLCNFTEEITILKSYKGIGDFTAVGLLLIIDDIQRFGNCKKLCAYVGVHPVFKKSGDGTMGHHMSKKGSKEARRILFNVAMSAIVSNDMIKGLYNHYQEKGKCKMAAIGIIMHKTLRIIYGMLKNKQVFDPEIDKANRKKFIGKEIGLKADNSRRFQKPDEKAPISKRHTRKRKQQMETRKENNIQQENAGEPQGNIEGEEQEESQNDKIIVNEIIAPAHNLQDEYNKQNISILQGKK